jgi:hypothetical protein
VLPDTFFSFFISPLRAQREKNVQEKKEEEKIPIRRIKHAKMSSQAAAEQLLHSALFTASKWISV